jgi:acyl-CoA synthetase (AMP-forming)/AMP-acid ligase II
MRPALLDGRTLGESLSNLTKAAPGSVAAFPAAGDQITSLELDGASVRRAHALLDAGIEPGALVGVLVPTDATFLVTVFALWRAGAAVSVLSAEAGFGDTAAAATRLARIVRMTGMRHLVLDPAYLPIGQLLRELVPQLTILDPRAQAAGSSGSLPAVEPESLAIVQFTSGSTSAPKGVMLPHRTVMAGLRACVVSGAFSPDDVFVQWVPTFHDMGLIGLLSHWLNGADVHAFTPVAFLRRPARILEYFAEHSGTVLTGPNFSYDYLLDAMAPDQLAALDLSSWRLAFNGAEPVSAATVRRFTEALAASGVGESVMYPVYGMAEATLSISYPRPGEVPRIVAVDRNELAAGGTVRALPGVGPGAKQVVSVGRPVHGVQVRIRGSGRESLRDRQLGEIQIRGDAVSPGYYGDPAATGQLFDDGWLRTGDLGFQLDGDLFVTGRLKEMIIVHGQNFFPEDVEAIARNVPGVYRRRCVAVAEETDDGCECAGVIVESAGAADEIRAQVARRVAAELGLAQVRVHVVKPRWLTRTTSGKWQRALAAKRVAAGEAGNLSADAETDVSPT